MNSPSVQSQVMSEDSLRSARLTVFWALALTLVGSLVGLTIGRWGGGVRGGEVWLVASSLIYSAVVLLVLVRVPFDRVPWVASLSSLFFLVYLSAGALLAFDQPSIIGSFMVYLLWFFPLQAFNRFANVSRHQAALSVCISLVPIGLALARIAVHSEVLNEVGVLIVYCLSNLTFALVLGLFTDYREAYIQQQERTRAEQAQNRALRESEQRFRRLFANAASGIGWLSMDGRCEDLNSTFGGMLGRPADELQGQPFSALVDADDQPRWSELLCEMQSSGQGDFATDLRLCSAQGKRLWTQLSFAVVPAADGQPQAIAFVCLDTTRAHQMQERLRQAQRLEAVGQLTGGVAHDFNNLLTVILGNTELLEDCLVDQPDLQQAAMMSRAAAERGAKLVSQLLSFARQQPLQPRTVALGELITDMAGMLRQALGKSNELLINVSEERCVTLIDPTQMESALLNLTINARDAMPSGGRLVIDVLPLSDDRRDDRLPAELPTGEYVLLRISDTGTGMSPETLARIFEPFFTTKPDGRGTGLGMAMVYGFISQSGGQVAVASSPGAGTVISICLPQYRAEGGVPAAAA